MNTVGAATMNGPMNANTPMPSPATKCLRLERRAAQSDISTNIGNAAHNLSAKPGAKMTGLTRERGQEYWPRYGLGADRVPTPWKYFSWVICNETLLLQVASNSARAR